MGKNIKTQAGKDPFVCKCSIKLAKLSAYNLLDVLHSPYSFRPHCLVELSVDTNVWSPHLLLRKLLYRFDGSGGSFLEPSGHRERGRGRGRGRERERERERVKGAIRGRKIDMGWRNVRERGRMIEIIRLAHKKTTIEV